MLRLENAIYTKPISPNAILHVSPNALLVWPSRMNDSSCGLNFDLDKKNKIHS
jgi:hypothetical protein